MNISLDDLAAGLLKNNRSGTIVLVAVVAIAKACPKQKTRYQAEIMNERNTARFVAVGFTPMHAITNALAQGLIHGSGWSNGDGQGEFMAKEYRAWVNKNPAPASEG